MVAFALLRASLFLVPLFAPAALAAPGAAKTVLTPFGERPVEDVHAVPEGVLSNYGSENTNTDVSLLGGQVVHVGGEVHLVDASGKVVHVAKNDGTKVRGTPIGDAVKPAQTGWVAYAYWYNTGSSPISSFTTTWTVPPAPRTYHSQTVFLFNSIEPASGNAILQPVLQFGPSAAGGGGYWAVASWYLVGSKTYFTRPVQVPVGKSLQGVITLTGHSGSSYNYVTSFSNVAGTSLTATGAAQLVWATETLEAYSITSPGTDYPSGSTVFSAINLRTSSGVPSVTWGTTSDSSDKLYTSVNNQGATNAKITIKYPS